MADMDPIVRDIRLTMMSLGKCQRRQLSNHRSKAQINASLFGTGCKDIYCPINAHCGIHESPSDKISVNKSPLVNFLLSTQSHKSGRKVSAANDEPLHLIPSHLNTHYESNTQAKFETCIFGNTSTGETLLIIKQKLEKSGENNCEMV